MSKRKYKPAKRICSLAAFENSSAEWFEFRTGNRFKMWHKAALQSLQVHTLMNFIKQGFIFECESVEKEQK